MARRMTQFVIQLKCEDVVQKNIPLKWYPKVYLLCFLAPTTKIKLILFDNRSQLEHKCVRERHTCIQYLPHTHYIPLYNWDTRTNALI